MALFRQQHNNIIRDALPVCVKREGVEIKEFPKAPKKPEGWIVHYDCTRCWLPRDSAKTRHKGTIHETAAALARAIEKKHPDCQHATATAAAVPATKRTLEECDEDLSRANKPVRAAESKSAELQRQLDAAAVDKATFQKQQSLDAKAAKRRAVHLNSDNQEQWDLTVDKEKHQKGNAMNAPMTGVLACMRYWCRGSIGKLLQIVLTLISQFRLEEPVLNVLQEPVATKQRTNDYIVYRLNCALQELKEDRTEAGRQAYRTILTAVAPE
jgi:hypothetical protein